MTFSANLQGKKVVVIDDGNEWCILISAVLKKSECVVRTFTDHTKYIDELNKKGAEVCPDCLIIDFHLSGSSEAPEVIREVKKTCDKALILAVSCDFQTDDDQLKTDKMISAINAGAHRAIPKNVKQIVDIMSTHLEVRKTLDGSIT
jgi:CheY-like chemotaxis protein